jgi:glycosyltransferase involved in cell wall biosynthesis
VHVFFVTEWYPTAELPIYGIFILEHARAVARKHNVSLLNILGIDTALDQPMQVNEQLLQPNLIVYQLTYSKPTIPRTAWIRKFIGARQVFSSASKNFGHPDIIHANVYNTAAISVIIGTLAKIPVVLSEYSSAYGLKRIKPGQIPFMRFFMNRVDVIMPDSNTLGQHIRSYGINRPMVMVHNVVDTDVFYPASHGDQVIRPYREIVLIARLSEEKAVHLAIQMLARLQQQGVYLYLHIAGDGPERARLESLVDNLGLADWIHFHGFLPKNELAKILRRSSAFLLTSLWESKPVVILEALTCGLPVVAPAIGGIPEIITPACGLLFQPGDIDDLASKMLNLLTNLASYNTQEIHNYAVNNFSSIEISNKLDSIYCQVVENRHAFDHTPGI